MDSDVETAELEELFRRKFGFTTRTAILDCKLKKPQNQLHLEIAKFTQDYDGHHRSHLLIVYYSGHGFLQTDESDQDQLYISGTSDGHSKNDENDENDQDDRNGTFYEPTCHWQSAESLLQHASADILTIMDCTYAAASSTKGYTHATRSFETIAATHRYNRAPGPHSFTRALIKSLADLQQEAEAKYQRPFDTSRLHNRIMRYMRPAHHLPSLFNRNPHRNTRHICLAPLAAQWPTPKRQRAEPSTEAEYLHMIKKFDENQEHGESTADIYSPSDGTGCHNSEASSFISAFQHDYASASSVQPSHLAPTTTDATSFGPSAGSQSFSLDSDSGNLDRKPAPSIAGTLGLPPSDYQRCAEAFAARFECDLALSSGSTNSLEPLRGPLPGILQTFAKMLRSHSAGGIEFKARSFVYNKHDIIRGRLIADSLPTSPSQSFVSRRSDDESIRQESEVEEEKDDARIITAEEKAAKEEYTQDWISSPDTTTDFSVDIESFIGQALPFLTEGVPWKWLLSRAESVMRLSWPADQSDDVISQEVMLHFPITINTLQRASATISWDPHTFFKEQFIGKPPPSLGDVIVLVGSQDRIQALTCHQYAQQTWPLLGLHILNAVQDAIDVNAKSSRECSIDVLDTNVAIALRGPELSVRVKGLTPMVAGVISQIAWMGAACRASPDPSRSCYTSARVEASRDDNKNLKLRIDYAFDFVKLSTKASCWQRMCRNASIAEDFPVPMRDEDEQGMEIPPPLMALLGDADYATECYNTFVLKGFWSLLVPVVQTERARNLVWHYLRSEDGSYIEYAALKDQTNVPNLDSNCLANRRHFVGWIPEAEVHAASKNVRLPADSNTRPRIGLQNLSIKVGKVVDVTGMLGRGQHLKPVSNVDFYQDNIQTEVGRLRKLPVVMFDTNGRRGWLVDGASAVLDVMKAQLSDHVFLQVHNLDKAPELHGCSTPHCGGDDALRVLLHPQNLQMALEGKSNPLLGGEEPPVETSLPARNPMQSQDLFTFRKLLRLTTQHLLVIHENLYEASTALVPDLRATLRFRFDGYAFRDVVDLTGEDPLILYLGQGGSAWLQYITQIKAIVLLGHGFGEIIRPTSTAEPCCSWTHVPAGEYLLATRVKTLWEFAQKYPEAEEFPRKLAPGIRWHQPDNLLEPFCKAEPKIGTLRPKAKCQRIQEMYQDGLRTVGPVRCPTPDACSKMVIENISKNCPGPAVIFGRPRKSAPTGVHRVVGQLRKALPFRRKAKAMGAEQPQPSEHIEAHIDSSSDAGTDMLVQASVTTSTHNTASANVTENTEPMSTSTLDPASTAPTSLAATSAMKNQKHSAKRLSLNDTPLRFSVWVQVCAWDSHVYTTSSVPYVAHI